MQIAAKLEYAMNRLFRDEITHIESPKKWVAKYKDIGKRLEGYIVNVTYKYAGKQKKFFDIDYGWLRLVSKEEAAKAAQNFYLMGCEEIKQRKK